MKIKILTGGLTVFIGLTKISIEVQVFSLRNVKNTDAKHLTNENDPIVKNFDSKSNENFLVTKFFFLCQSFLLIDCSNFLFPLSFHHF